MRMMKTKMNNVVSRQRLFSVLLADTLLLGKGVVERWQLRPEEGGDDEGDYDQGKEGAALSRVGHVGRQVSAPPQLRTKSVRNVGGKGLLNEWG